MKLSELPEDVQLKLHNSMIDLKNHEINTSYEILKYNEQGTRYFYANRIQKSWSDNKGNYMPFGGGSEWAIKYGAVQFRSYLDPMRCVEYELYKGKTYSKSLNGTIIPKSLNAKKDVLNLIDEINIF